MRVSRNANTNTFQFNSCRKFELHFNNNKQTTAAAAAAPNLNPIDKHI